VGSSSKSIILLQFDSRHDQFVPVIQDTGGAADVDPKVVCPGAGIDMPALSMQVYGRLPEDQLLGIYERLRICWATSETIRQRAASGGVVPAVLAQLFETGAIDAAYCLVTDGGPYEACARILRSAEDIGRLHGSVYHPFDFGRELRALFDGKERFAFVGLPCQIAGLEEVKRQRPDIAARHVMSIGLFCGGINRFGGIQHYLSRYGVSLGEVLHIDYRSGPWPGGIHVQLRDGSKREIPRIRGNSRIGILRYMVAFQGYWMLKRCRICPDQVADFADIAVGDPHLPEYRSRGGAGFSIVVTRSPRGEQMVHQLVASGKLKEEPCDRAQVVASQGYTLDNRRHAAAYVRVARLLGEAAPRLNVYPAFARGSNFRHYKYALVDLLKIKLRRVRWLRPLYVPVQVFEYVFVTLCPSLMMRRLKRLVFNEGENARSHA
jgi:coenzyme F420 hydrogenase subunit beta